MAAIIAFLSSGWGKLVEWGTALLAASGLVIAVYSNIKSSGKQEQIVVDQTKELENVKKAATVTNAVNVMSSTAVHTELYANFSRDG